MSDNKIKISIKDIIYRSNRKYRLVYVNEGTIAAGIDIFDSEGHVFSVIQISKEGVITNYANKGDNVEVLFRGRGLESLKKGKILTNSKNTQKRKNIRGDETSKDNVSLIDPSFFEKGINIKLSNIYPVIVLATMSSGKSTLINAFLGEEVLPNANHSCTSKRISILDDDSLTGSELYISYLDGRIINFKDNVFDHIEKANADKDVKSVLITRQVKSIFNTDKAILLIDTPGPNDAVANENKKVTYDTLGKLKGGLVLYVINATQIGINDDKKMLEDLAGYVKENTLFNVLFVLNKVDELDIDKESLHQLIENVHKYLNEVGFENPDIIPVSARGALLFRKMIHNSSFSRLQRNEFKRLYDLFKTKDFRMSLYMDIKDYDELKQTRKLGNLELEVSELVAAVENTGITYIENYMLNRLIECGEKKDYKVNISK